TAGCGGGSHTPPAAANAAGHSAHKGGASVQHTTGSGADEKVGFDGFRAWMNGVWSGVYQNKYIATITVGYNKNFGQAPWPGLIEVQVKSDKLYPDEDWITLRAFREVVWTAHDELY